MKPGRRRAPWPGLAEAELAVGIREGRFLGRFDATALREELARERILSALAARGYAEVRIETSVSAGEHRLRLRFPGGRASLVDLRLQEATLLVEEPLLKARGGTLLSVLANTWLSLQDPRGRFTVERPRLPGQRYPGLGLTGAFYALTTRWAREWGKDALLATPQYYHNAVFYARGLSFLSPADQGRFLALRRDLGSLPVAAASAAVAEGRVRELGSGSVLRWPPAPMAAGLTEPLAEYLGSRDYEREVEALARALRFALRGRPERLRRARPGEAG